MAGAALRAVLPAHGAAGTAQVRQPRLERPLRVQPVGSGRQHPVLAEPSRRHGRQEGETDGGAAAGRVAGAGTGT